MFSGSGDCQIDYDLAGQSILPAGAVLVCMNAILTVGYVVFYQLQRFPIAFHKFIRDQFIQAMIGGVVGHIFKLAIDCPS